MITCAQAWNINAAHVVCKKLGYELGAVEIFFAEGTTRSDKVITRLDCPETVSNLADCTIEIMDLESAEDCDLDQVTAVACSAPDNNVQLIGGSSTSEGVLEYKINGLPSLICDPDWSDTEAAVACRMRGYETGIKSDVMNLGHSRESFPYSFQNYNYTCLGTETSLEACQARTIEGVDVCNPDDIVQVTCQPNKDWDSRLVGSDASEQGRVEVFLGGEWGSIDRTDGHVSQSFKDNMCQNLGYKESLGDTYYSDLDGTGENPFGAGTGKVLRCDVSRDGNECDVVLSDIAAEETRYALNVICLPYGTVENHPVRLVSETGVAKNRTGRVEILHDGVWGSVCDSITRSLPMVVCKELGYNSVNHEHLHEQEKEPFITGDEMIWFTIVNSCSFESRLYECLHGPWGQNPEDCSPSVVSCGSDDGGGDDEDDMGDDDNENDMGDDDGDKDDDDVEDDDDGGDAGPSSFRAHRIDLILGAALMALLAIKA